MGVELISTGGTSAALRAEGLPVKDVSELTGFPEMLDGRVKTLHPKVHGGLLAIRGNAQHDAQAAEHGIAPIDLLVVNLYPFEATVAKGAGYDECIENIDIGGPALIRGAAKNHADVTVDRRSAGLRARAGADARARRRDDAGNAQSACCQGVRAHGGLRCGDQPVVRRDARRGAASNGAPSAAGSRCRCATAKTRTSVPHSMPPAMRGPAWRWPFSTKARNSPTTTSMTPTRRWSWWPSSPSAGPAVAIIKHANPCGAATAATLKDAYLKALRCDPVSAFGGIVALSGTIDAAAAEEIAKIFTEVVIAPAATDEAKKIFAAKKNLRLLTTGALPDPRAAGVTVRSLAGGLLVQSRDNGVITAADLKVVSKRRPSERELADLLFAFKVAKHVKSNAIVYAKDGATVGIGAGQMSRVDSVRIAALKAADAARRVRIERAPDARVGRRLGRLLPVRRRVAGGRRSRRHRRHSAGRLDAGRGSDRRRRRQGPCHGLHRHAPLPALSVVTPWRRPSAPGASSPIGS